MNTFPLLKLVQKSKRRIGRGYGSGRGKTAGRGTKGQNARGRRHPAFEGGQLSLIKRIPLLRGKGKNKRTREKAFPLDISKIDTLSEKQPVTLENLKKAGIAPPRVRRVQLLGKGTLAHAYEVSVPCSKSAKGSVEKAGGRVVSKE